MSTSKQTSCGSSCSKIGKEAEAARLDKSFSKNTWAILGSRKESDGSFSEIDEEILLWIIETPFRGFRAKNTILEEEEKPGHEATRRIFGEVNGSEFCFPTPNEEAHGH